MNRRAIFARAATRFAASFRRGPELTRLAAADVRPS